MHDASPTLREPPHIHSRLSSNDHLRNPLPSERLASHETLPFEPSDEVAYRCQKEHNGRRDQTGGVLDQAKPLNEAHRSVNRCAHIVRGEASDEVVKRARRRANAEEQGNFDEY